MYLGDVSDKVGVDEDEWRTDLWVNFLQWAEKGHQGRPSEVGDGPQAGEKTAVPHLLKVALTHILSITQTKREGSLVDYIII